MTLRETVRDSAANAGKNAATFARAPLQTDITLDLPAWQSDPKNYSSKIGLPDSLNLSHVRHRMTRQMDVAIVDGRTVARVRRDATPEGIRRVLVTTDGEEFILYEARPAGEEPYHNNDLLERITGGVVEPVARWGEQAVLIQHFLEQHPLFSTIPEPQLKHYLGLISATMKEFQHDENGLQRPVQFGMCVSPASMNKDEVKSGQTVLGPHGQVTANPQLDSLTNKTIEDVRDRQLWDGGISRHLGTRFIVDISDRLRDGNPGVSFRADPMGARVKIPGLTVEDINSTDFVNGILQPIFEGAQRQIQEAHRAVFKKPWDEALAVVQDERQKGDITQLNMKRYNNIFRQKSVRRALRDSSLAPDVIKRIHELYDAGEIRWPPGWSFAIRFSPGEDALIAITFGVAKFDHGPDEGLGMKPNRMTTVLSEDEAHMKAVFVGKKLDTVVKQLQQE